MLFELKFWVLLANIGGFLALLTNVTNLFDTGHLTDVPKKKGLVLGNALAFIWGAVSALILVVVFVVAVPEEKVQAILLAIAGGIFGRAVIEKVVRKKLQDLNVSIEISARQGGISL